MTQLKLSAFQIIEVSPIFQLQGFFLEHCPIKSRATTHLQSSTFLNSRGREPVQPYRKFNFQPHESHALLHLQRQLNKWNIARNLRERPSISEKVAIFVDVIREILQWSVRDISPSGSCRISSSWKT